MIVLDSCAIVDIVRQTQEGLILQDTLMQEGLTISCDLVRAEAASVFRKLTRTEGLTPVLAEQYLNVALSLIDEFYSIEELLSEAFRESIRLDHPTYDIFYLVLARRTGAKLITLDQRLMDLCKSQGVSCITRDELQR